MSILLKSLEPSGTRWGGPNADYLQGTFINGTGQGKRDGSYAKAEWANEVFGVLSAILKQGGQTPDGQPETARRSQVLTALRAIIKADVYTHAGDPTAEASGTSDVITATFTKPVALAGGQTVKVRAIAANTSTAPTFNPNGLGAKPIVKGDNDPLAVGDIAGAGFWITLIYDATIQKWVLQNPATGVTLVLPVATESGRGVIQLASASDLANGTDTEKALTSAIVSDYLKLNTGVPVGTMITFAGKTVPEGYLLCNGAAVSRTTYARLFAAIGTTYGAGDGSTTFNLPDVNERFLQGTNALSSVGTKREAQLPAITGKLPFIRSNINGSQNAGEGVFWWSGANDVIYTPTEKTGSGKGTYDPCIDASRSSSAYKGSTVQPAAVLTLVAIRY